MSIPQLSDFEPKGAACAAFGVLHEGGFPQRALVITGPDGVVRWSYQAPSPAELPGVELLRDGLATACGRREADRRSFAREPVRGCGRRPESDPPATRAVR